MRAYALCELGDREAIDIFICRDDAFAALQDALGTSPFGRGRSASG